jgi:glycosyltransferase involved in cell wall biosynthesis
MPRVSVLTPTYNAAPFVRACVESVLAQRFSDWELVVADDGSTDGTPDLVESYRDPRVRCLRLPHRGLRALADTYNAALAASRGELVAVLEGDDYWPPNKLEVQVRGFDDPAVQLSWGGGHDVDREGRFLELSRPVPLDGSVVRIPNERLFHDLLVDDVLVPAITVMARRSALDRIGGFRREGTALYVDLPTWLRLVAVNPGVSLYYRSVLGYWRRHPTQVTSLREEEVVRARWRVVRDVVASLAPEDRARVGWSTEVERRNWSRWSLACARAALRKRRFERARRLQLGVLRRGPGLALRGKALKGLVSAAVGLDLSAAWRRLRGR